MSSLLGTELRPVAAPETAWRPAATWLRVIDPMGGGPIPVPEEEHEELQVAQERLSAMQERLATEARVRTEAEERAARAEVALQTLRAQQAPGLDTQTPPEAE